MLVTADRNFYSFELWQKFRDTGADLLWRVNANLELPVLKRLPDDSYLSIAFQPRTTRRQRERIIREFRETGETSPADGHLVRAVEYDIPDREGNGTGELICVITSILDPAEATAAELADAYHQRWECENLIDEIKTHQRGPAHILRSQSPEMVRQDIWAFLLAHYGVRKLMCRAADEVGEDPDRLSFIRSVRTIRRHITGQADFSPDHLKRSLAEALAEILEKRTKQRERTNPRVIKRARHNSYRVKRAHHRGTRHDSPPTINIRG